MKLLISSILAGIMIGLGGTIYLSVDNPIIGSILFSIGLMTISFHSWSLFTGKVGYFCADCTILPMKIVSIITIWFGNLIGTNLVALGLILSNKQEIISKASFIVSNKLSNDVTSVFILSIFCGVLMYLAVDSFRKCHQNERMFMVIFPVVVFILCGFEHCVANMFYFGLSQSWDINSIKYLLIMTFGNAFGSIVINRMVNIVDWGF